MTVVLRKAHMSSASKQEPKLSLLEAAPPEASCTKAACAPESEKGDMVVAPDVDVLRAPEADAALPAHVSTVRRRLFEDDKAEDVFHDVPTLSQQPAGPDEAFVAALAAAWRASREPVDDDALFAALNADAALQEEEILRSLGRSAAKPYVASREPYAPPTPVEQAEQAERLRKIRERADAAQKRSKNLIHSPDSIE